MTAPRRLVLASASPRRRRLLETLGLDFEVRPVDLDESPLDGEAPEEMVLRLARAKAEAALGAEEARPEEVPAEVLPAEVPPFSGNPAELLAAEVPPFSAQRSPVADELVLAADTIVVLDGRVLGKPADAADARRLLADLAGREHAVLTGVALADTATGERRAALDRTAVRIAPLDAERIAWYVATGEPMDKAGAYAIQGIGAALVESIDGNYTNVVGLPLPTVRRLLGDLGLELLELRRDE